MDNTTTSKEDAMSLPFLFFFVLFAFQSSSDKNRSDSSEWDEIRKRRMLEEEPTNSANERNPEVWGRSIRPRWEAKNLNDHKIARWRSCCYKHHREAVYLLFAVHVDEEVQFILRVVHCRFVAADESSKKLYTYWLNLKMISSLHSRIEHERCKQGMQALCGKMFRNFLNCPLTCPVLNEAKAGKPTWHTEYVSREINI